MQADAAPPGASPSEDKVVEPKGKKPQFEVEHAKAELRDGLARMKLLVEQLRRRLDRRRSPRDSGPDAKSF